MARTERCDISENYSYFDYKHGRPAPLSAELPIRVLSAFFGSRPVPNEAIDVHHPGPVVFVKNLADMLEIWQALGWKRS